RDERAVVASRDDVGERAAAVDPELHSGKGELATGIRILVLMLGILALDTAFPRIRGDVGAADTFDFPVRIATVARASVDAVVHERDEALLGEFVAQARKLAQAGCAGIVTTCGFLVRWQDELAAAVDVPVLTSPLLLLPLVQRMLPRDRTVGVVTYSAASLSHDLPGT